jgi:hypothetical protein
MIQNALAISGNGSSATAARRQSTPSVIIATTSTSVSVPSNAARNASPAAISIASMSLVASAIRVAGALAMEEPRTLRRKPLIEPRAQFDAEAVCSREKLKPPADAQQVDCDAHRDQPSELLPERRPGEVPCHQAVDHSADLAWHPDRQHRDREQHPRRRQIGAPMAADEAADQLGQGQGNARRGRAAIV